MQDHVLNASAPLYGRADQIIKLQPLLPGYIPDVIAEGSARSLLNFYTCWGGVPRYWELQELGYVHREVPFGEDERRGKKATYRLADPFLCLWFKTVASHRGILQTATPDGRKKLLDQVWPQLQAQAWEELCRLALPRMKLFKREWRPAARHWKGNQSEWDAVSTSLDGDRMILGECKSLLQPAGKRDISRLLGGLLKKPISSDLRSARFRPEFVLFVPELKAAPVALPDGVTVVDGSQVFSALK